MSSIYIYIHICVYIYVCVFMYVTVYGRMAVQCVHPCFATAFLLACFDMCRHEFRLWTCVCSNRLLEEVLRESMHPEMGGTLDQTEEFKKANPVLQSMKPAPLDDRTLELCVQRRAAFEDKVQRMLQRAQDKETRDEERMIRERNNKNVRFRPPPLSGEPPQYPLALAPYTEEDEKRDLAAATAATQSAGGRRRRRN